MISKSSNVSLNLATTPMESTIQELVSADKVMISKYDLYLGSIEKTSLTLVLPSKMAVMR